MTHAIDPAAVERAAEAMAPIWGLMNLYEGLDDERTVFVPLGMLRRARHMLASAIPEAGEEAVREVLADMRSGQNELDAMGLISALSAARDEAVRERDEARRLLAQKDKLLASRPFQPTAEQAMERIEHFCKTDELEEQRDAALAELAKLRAAEAHPDATLTAALEEARGALEAFAAKAESDIGSDESDRDLFRPMMQHNEAPHIRVGDLRRARVALATINAALGRKEP